MENKKLKPLMAIILAAGKGTRMRSKLPKVLHKVAGKTMLHHVIHLAEQANCGDRVVIVGHEGDMVASQAEHCLIAWQNEQLGTAHAVLQAKDYLTKHEGDVIILYADTPLVQLETIEKMRQQRALKNASIALLGFYAEDPASYGRLVLDGDVVTKIVEAKDATEEELEINACNSGVILADAKELISFLENVNNNNAKQEYYLTDIIQIAAQQNKKTIMVECAEEEVLGVNSRLELSVAENIIQNRLRDKAMVNGVTLLDPETTYFSCDTKIGQDVIIGANVVFGEGVEIENNVEIKSFCHIEGAFIGEGSTIGPFARLRPDTKLNKNVHIGNFVEIKKSTLGEGAKVNHLSYIGDASIGKKTNIGAGTITCNYDGFNKFKTTIGDNVFIGSDTLLVAPVTIKDGAMTGSGSVITENIDTDMLALTRPPLIKKNEWAKKFREKNGK